MEFAGVVDSVQPFEEGRRMAAMISGARFVALDGRNHIMLGSERAWSRFLEEIGSFLGSTDLTDGRQIRVFDCMIANIWSSIAARRRRSRSSRSA